MEKMFEGQAPEATYKMIGEELMGLIKAMKENPKSYTIWFH